MIFLIPTNIKSITYALKTNKGKDWVGKKIKLYTIIGKFFGIEQPAIRVKLS